MSNVVQILSERDFNFPLVREIVSSNEPDFATIRRKAIDCIDDLVTDEYKPSIITNRAFMLVLWLLRYFDESVISSKFINAQRDILSERLSKLSNEDIEEYCKTIGMPVSYDIDLDVFGIPFDTFVKNNIRISGEKYRLSYQSVVNGTVYANQELTVKITREYFVRSSFAYIAGIDANVVKTVFRPYSEFISSMRAVYEQLKSRRKVDLGAVDASKFPPCIREYISEMKAGVNLPHLARFTLVAFLNKSGMTREEIMELFRTAPDFNEKMTTYQVEHVMGLISGTEYTPPKCSALKSNHLCFMGEDTLCNQEWLRHPLQYYQIKKKSK